MTKQEFQAILENSEQAFITHDDSQQAKYFNSKGHEMLKRIAEMTENMEAVLEDLDIKKRSFEVYGQVKNLYDN